jgi:hypothetical protein
MTIEGQVETELSHEATPKTVWNSTRRRNENEKGDDATWHCLKRGTLDGAVLPKLQDIEHGRKCSQ